MNDYDAGSEDWWAIVEELFPDVLKAEGFDDCAIGVVTRCGQPPILIYSQAKVLRKLQNDGMAVDEAILHYEENILGAWFGDGTPGFMFG